MVTKAELTKDMLKQEGTIQFLNQENVELANKLSNITTQLTNANDKLLNQVDDLNNKVLDKSKAISSLHNVISNKESEIDELRAKLGIATNLNDRADKLCKAMALVIYEGNR